MANKAKDEYLIDVFTPCVGYLHDALDNTGTDMPVTCVACLNARFSIRCKKMNLGAIEHLDEPELLDYFLDREAMSILFEEL